MEFYQKLSLKSYSEVKSSLGDTISEATVTPCEGNYFSDPTADTIVTTVYRYSNSIKNVQRKVTNY